MPVLLVQNQTPGPLILVDERGGDRQEYTWEPNGTPNNADHLEVPKELAANINFRRNVQKRNLVIVAEIEDSLAALSNSDWTQRQMGAGAVPQTSIGEAGAIPVIIDKQAAQPIVSMQTDVDGNILDVQSMSEEDREKQRQAMQPGAPQQQVPNRQPIAPAHQPEPPAPTVVIEGGAGTVPAATEGGQTRQPQYRDDFISQAPEIPTPGMKTTEQIQQEGEQPPPGAPSHLDPNQP